MKNSEGKKGLTQISQMTQIKNENRYGMNRIKGIYKIWSISSVRTTDTNDWFLTWRVRKKGLTQISQMTQI